MEAKATDAPAIVCRHVIATEIGKLSAIIFRGALPLFTDQGSLQFREAVFHDLLLVRLAPDLSTGGKIFVQHFQPILIDQWTCFGIP